MSLVTVFTPTYNRGYIIENLYKSLEKQTCKDFEWLVIDDGSTDNTEELMTDLIGKADIDIRYYKKQNGGKHTATNLALTHARGELFFVVDSDDYLSETAVERISYYYDPIRKDARYCGVCGLKAFFNGKIIGSEIKYTLLDAKILDYRYRHNVTGDKADVFKTALLKKHTFPEYPGEKWCPLSLVWNRFNEKYLIRYFAEVIYYAEYLPDGMSLNRLEIRKKSPNTCLQYYAELSTYNIPLLYRVKSSINYWRFAFYSDRSFMDKVQELGIIKSIAGFPFGMILYMVDSIDELHQILLDPKSNILTKQN